MEPLPIDPGARCDLVGDERQFRGSAAPDYLHEGRASSCLNEGRYADAIPYLERAVRADGNPRFLVALGVAYDCAGRSREASDRWRQARRIWSAKPPQAHLDFRHPIGLEAALFDRRYAQALVQLEQYFSPNSASSPYRGQGVFDHVAQSLSEALHVAAQGQPQRGAEMISALYSKVGWRGEVRYPRAIMLMAIGRRDEARFELRLAARSNLVYSSDWGPHPFQWSALAILEHLA